MLSKIKLGSLFILTKMKYLIIFLLMLTKIPYVLNDKSSEAESIRTLFLLAESMIRGETRSNVSLP